MNVPVFVDPQELKSALHGFSLKDLPGTMDDRDRWREIKENLSCQGNLLMMIKR